MKKQNKKFNNIKFSYEEVRDKIESLGYTLVSQKYKNCESRLIIKDDEGYFYRSRLSDLSSGKKPRYVSSFNVFAIRNISNYMHLHEIPCKLLSEKYINAHSPMLFQCKCGIIFKLAWCDLSARKIGLCAKCSKKKQTRESTLDLSIIVKAFQERGYTLLSDIYINAHTPIACKNKDGYCGELSYGNLMMGYHIGVFKVRNPYLIYNMNHYIYTNGIDCKLITASIGDCKRLKDFKLSFKCACGSAFSVSWGSFTCKYVHRCQECSNKKSSYEVLTSQFLDESKIIYHEEYSFSDCKDKLPLFFDFVMHCRNEVMAIEVDGHFHYKSIYGEDRLNDQIRKDNIKNQYCLENDIILLRIPYWEYNDDSYKEIIQKGLDKLQS